MSTARAMPDADHDHQRTEECLRVLVGGITDYAIVMLDPNGRVASWNTGAQHVLGYPAAEVVGASAAKFYLPEDVMQGRPAEVLRIVQATGRHEEEGWQLRRNGSRFRSHSVITKLEEPGGALLGYSMVTRDVTARWEREESLRVSEGRFRALLTCVPHYVSIMLDPRGRVATWSDEAARLTGYSSEEILGVPSSVFYTAKDLSENKPYRDLALARSDGRYEFEDWRVHKGGARVWTYVVITALVDPAGNLLGFSEATRDISARKRTMDALERKAEEFQKSSDELEQSIWVAVHDLREPLHLIASSTSHLAARYAGCLDPDADELIRCAVDETRRMQRVLRDLLAAAPVACRERGLLGQVFSRDAESGSRAHDLFLPEESFYSCAAPSTEVPRHDIAEARERMRF